MSAEADLSAGSGSIEVDFACLAGPTDARKKFLYILKAGLRAAACGGRPRPATPSAM
jgi:hypothetical protein